ncbi:ChrR family anti-sigma-E factor [Pleionea litopenaei]|uniref:ChrR family anti-sigma-E factor n=1 Tax=Pleionea litopenaei TaxID=3070815 RepID=A0AA51RVA1_9GAMM|nr:ChrR family anti-sigma-E factor [Pleionea sp. HL-JVS1]WMS88227.1 ChrR family anti-sigma-E factor [Pleionea sp. HL-JVS1]
MSCNHHPNSETLLQYSAGRISGLSRLMVKLHCKVCEHCQHAVDQFEQLGGQALESMPDTPVSSDAFANIMSRIHAEPTISQPRDNDYSALIERILTRGSNDKLNWHWRTKRFAEILLPISDDGHEAKLIYFKKGMKVPQHTHRDKEYTLVLKGSFADDTGEYKRGDYVCKSALDEHAPIATSDCICLAITTQPLKFTGTFGPVLNWFLN